MTRSASTPPKANAVALTEPRRKAVQSSKIVLNSPFLRGDRLEPGCARGTGPPSRLPVLTLGARLAYIVIALRSVTAVREQPVENGEPLRVVKHIQPQTVLAKHGLTK
jgi:hypothetical protein